ncbi:MAG TPA: hypothetical protein VHZ32_19320, partial [Rhizomicrobium sp.]|nr:hypothetical protein [Rhizomicrobium sp.]
SPLGQAPLVLGAVKQNIFLVAFAVYGVLMAFLLPRVFHHSFNVPSLRVLSLDLYAVSPVQFSSQNITTSVYIIGTMLAALASTLAVQFEHKENKIVSAILWVSWIHIGFGLLDIIFTRAGHATWLDIFRNGSYAQLSQDVGAVHRVSGIFPEPSAYAGYGFGLFVANTELWLRNERSRQTGLAALAMVIMLLVTTSSTAYFSIVLYAILIALRAIATPMRLAPKKLVYLSVFAFLFFTSLLAVTVFFPALSKLMIEVGDEMTFRKMNSSSGLQRAFWAHEGWMAFWKTNAIGIGPGSFRSSGLISSIAGSAGFIGLLLFGLYLFNILRPFRAISHRCDLTGGLKVRSAMAWTAVLSLIPASASAASPDPGLVFGIFAGIAMACRQNASQPQPAPSGRKILAKPQEFNA